MRVFVLLVMVFSFLIGSEDGNKSIIHKLSTYQKLCKSKNAVEIVS